jgi:hypothetical protein
VASRRRQTNLHAGVQWVGVCSGDVGTRPWLNVSSLMKTFFFPDSTPDFTDALHHPHWCPCVTRRLQAPRCTSSVPRDSISRSPKLHDGNATAAQLCHRGFCGGDDDDDIKDDVCRFFSCHDCGRRRALGASRGRGARDGSGPRRGGRWLCHDQSPPRTSPNQRPPSFQQVCCWSM